MPPAGRFAGAAGRGRRSAGRGKISQNCNIAVIRACQVARRTQKSRPTLPQRYSSMKKNVIVLTHGWSGSSMLAALLGTAQYWLGDETGEKSDYDTFENRRLVELNRQMMGELMGELGLTESYEHEFSFESVLELERRADRLDWDPY